MGHPFEQIDEVPSPYAISTYTTEYPSLLHSGVCF